MVVRELRLLQLVLSVLAMGVGLGLSSGKVPGAKVKTVDEYWAETGIGPELVEETLNDEFCRGSARSFLSCANAVLAVAGQLQLAVDFSGALREAPSGSPAFERDILEPWKIFFQTEPLRARNLSFQGIWAELVARLPDGRRSYFTALAYNAHLSVYKDPHTYLIPVEYYRKVVASSNSVPMALGIVVAQSPGGYFLRKVMPRSPADNAGLRRGDVILNVDGHDLSRVSFHRLSEVLRGRPGDVASTFYLHRDGRSFSVRVVRSPENIPNVTWRSVKSSGGEGSAALLTVNKFSQGTCQDVRQELAGIQRAGASMLLLDLRDNSGGHMLEASCLVGLFTGPGKLVYRVRYLQRDREPDLEYTSEEKVWRGRMAVLVNSGTASAAEIVAGALRDHRRAFLVGERTFGKGSFQEGEEWAGWPGVAIFSTKGFYALPSGEAPQQRGLRPDLEILDDVTFVVRESDQYAFPLENPRLRQTVRSRPLENLCPQFEMVGDEDPVETAARFLACPAVSAASVGGPRASR